MCHVTCRPQTPQAPQVQQPEPERVNQGVARRGETAEERKVRKEQVKLDRQASIAQCECHVTGQENPEEGT